MNTGSLLFDRLRATTLLIRRDDKRLGTGVFVAPEIVVTCAHVIGALPIGARVKLWWSGQDVDGEIMSVYSAPYPDLAFIRIPYHRHPFALLNPSFILGDSLLAWGYTERALGGESVTLEVEGLTVLDDGGQEALLKVKGGQVELGMSGAGAVNMRTGGVCGIVKSTRDRHASAGGRLVSSEMILVLEPTIRNIQRLAVYVPDNWSFDLSEHQKKDESWRHLWFEPTVEEGERAKYHSILTKAEAHRARIARRSAAGSNLIQIADLLIDDCLLVPFPWRSGHRICSIEPSILSYLLTPVAPPFGTREISRKMLILSNSGGGKSTLSYIIFSHLLDNCIRDTTGSILIPVLLDLRDYVGSTNFGTEEWIRDFSDSLGISIPNNERDQDSANIYLILDSLDEYLSRFRLDQMNTELNKHIFRLADLVICRTQFFERFLAMSEFAGGFEVAYLCDWSEDVRQEYIRKLATFLPDQKGVHFPLTNDTSASAESVLTLCTVPLQINMVVDLLCSSVDVRNIKDLLALYQSFVFNWLQRESLKFGNTLSVDEKFEWLELAAWRFYDEAQVAREECTPFTRNELVRLIREYETGQYKPEEIAEDMILRTMLVSDESSSYVEDAQTFRFLHKSYQEYLIARYLYHSILQDVARASEAFMIFHTPEVSELLKEYIKRINQSPRKRKLASQNCIEAIHSIKQREIPSSRARIALQQLGYYVGQFTSVELPRFLDEWIQEENDLWTRRGLVIGLAFAGHERYLQQYIEGLRAERATGERTPENDVNLGFHLSFFGDQQFDAEAPDRDQGHPFCHRTLKRLLYQLGTETDRASWRLNLYTICDVVRNREVSQESSRIVLRERHADLREILERLKQEDKCASWPEIAECEQLLKEILV